MRLSDVDVLSGRLIAAVPAPLLLILAITLLSAGSGYSKVLLTGDNVLAFGFVRIALGALILLLIARPSVLNLDRRHWRDVALLGLVIAVFKVADLYALVAMPLGLMVTIGFLGPLAVSLSGARSVVEVLWPLLGFAGVVMLAPLGADSTLSWGALGLGLLSALAWGTYIVVSARVGQTIHGIQGFAIANVVAALILLPTGISGSGQFFADAGTAALILGITLLAVVPLGLEFMALKRLRPNVFGVLLSLEPAIASLLGLVILGEQLRGTDWLAVGIVSVASIGATLMRRPAQPER